MRRLLRKESLTMSRSRYLGKLYQILEILHSDSMNVDEIDIIVRVIINEIENRGALIKKGLAKTSIRGRLGGRKNKYSPKFIKEIQESYSDGEEATYLQRKHDIKTSTFYGLVNKKVPEQERKRLATTPIEERHSKEYAEQYRKKLQDIFCIEKKP